MKAYTGQLPPWIVLILSLMFAAQVIDASESNSHQLTRTDNSFLGKVFYTSASPMNKH